MCVEAERDEARRRLVPARVEAHESRIAGVLKRSLGAVGGRKRSTVVVWSPSRASVGRIENARVLALDRIVERDVEHAPAATAARRRRRGARSRSGAGRVRERALVARERPVGRQRHARGDDAGRRESRIVGGDVESAGDPEQRGVVQLRLQLRRGRGAQIEVRAGAQREVADRASPRAGRARRRAACGRRASRRACTRHARRHLVRERDGAGGERGARRRAWRRAWRSGRDEHRQRRQHASRMSGAAVWTTLRAAG